MKDEDVLQPVEPVKKPKDFGGRPKGSPTKRRLQKQRALIDPNIALDPEDWAALLRTERESTLKARCLAVVRGLYPRYVIFQHQDHGHAGIPDWSVTGGDRTLWLEFKYADPTLVSRGIQELTCRYLEDQGHNCFYVVYLEAEKRQETLIVLPSAVYRGAWLTETIGRAQGFDHNMVAAFIGATV